jgi:hypothetical protein
VSTRAEVASEETTNMTIEMGGGRVTVQSKSKGSKQKVAEATSDQPAPATKKGKRKATPAATGETPTEPATNEATRAPAEATPAPSRRGRQKDTPSATTEPATLNATTPGHDATLPVEPPAATGATLADLAAGYLAHLEASGKSQGTVLSYRLELTIALNELGKNTPTRELTGERVKAFFESERVTKTLSGRMKSPLSIDKTRRCCGRHSRGRRSAGSWTRG